MSAYKRLNIKSRIKDYSVQFIGGFSQGLDRHNLSKIYLIIDKKVAGLYGKQFKDIWKKYPYLLLQAEESVKTLEYAKIIIRRLIESDVKRDCRLVAIGGGVIQDISAFVASILYRGVDWIFYPTTLLAQSDSCIGSKTSINIDEYKNQVGNFYPPSKIFLNTGFLKTLSDGEIKSGMGEIIKVHLLDGKKSFSYIYRHYESALKDKGLMRELIFRSLKIKKRVIEKDEFDSGYRNIMNYGHTFGHALESLTDYGLPHGQAVTVGMDISNYLSLRLGYINNSLFLRLHELLLRNWPNYNFKGCDRERFFKSLGRDKKNSSGMVNAILTRGPGKMFKHGLVLGAGFRKEITGYFREYLNNA